MAEGPQLRTAIPGPNAQKVVARDTAALVRTTKCAPVVAASAQGVYVTDVDGNRLLDFASGVSVVNTGHRHPKVLAAIRAQLDQFVHVEGQDFYYDVQVRLAERLAELAPLEAPAKSFFSNSGTEANEAAIKLARWSSGRPRLLAFLGAFHGRTLGALALTASKPVHQAKVGPTIPGVHHVPFADCYRCPYKLDPSDCGTYCADVIEEQYFLRNLPPAEVAACFFEPVQGEGGYVVPPAEFVRKLSRLCHDNGILLVADEVQSGMGRTGKLFAMEHFGIKPDIVTLAKSLGSGLPIGATLARKGLDFGVSGAHSNTFGGNPVACASALATLDVLQQEDLIGNAARMGTYLHQRLLELQQRHEPIGDVRGMGLMQAIDIVKDRTSRAPNGPLAYAIVDAAISKGLLLLSCGPSAIRVIPPLLITSEQIDAGIEVLDAAIVQAIRASP